MNPSDLDLARKAANGERDAFQPLLERHYDMLYRLAYRFFGSVAEAEDVTHEICLGLASRIGGFQGRSQFTTWLYRVAINACRDHARRESNARKFAGASAAFAEMQAADWQDTENKVAWLHEAIATLDPAMKETVLLVVAEDLSHRQAAEILGIAETTVSWRMHEARKRLKAMVESANE